MTHPLKITSTLADETRFSIYEMILQTKKTYTVQQVAEKFFIHPNVARLHLTKLTEIGVVVACYEKTGRGGRPGRVYKASEEVVTLSFPKRENHQLLEWMLELFDRLGEEVLPIAKDIAYQDGFKQMQLLVPNSTIVSMEKKIEILSKASSLIGYVPNFENHAESITVRFTVFNCPYKDYLAKYQAFICLLHEGFLKGQMDALFGKHDFVQFGKISSNCEFCEYAINTHI